MLKIGSLIELKPTNNRFKNLIAQFGKDWITISSPIAMHCFNNEVGVTCRPCNIFHGKTSNFRLKDVGK